MHDVYDVVVVGAGPSGSSAGRSAALGGADTLLVEKKKEIGVPVKCGEFIPSLNEIEKLLPNSDSIRCYYTDLSEEVVSNRTTRIRLYSPKNRSYEFDFDGWVLNREVFDRTLALRAEEAGAKVQTSTVVKAVHEKAGAKKVLMRNSAGETFVETRLLIGADGFPSNISKWTNLKNQYKADNVILCAQRRLSDVKLKEEDVVEICLSKKYAPGGYAWVIPKGNREVNVGVGVRLSHLMRGKLITDYLNDFLERHPIFSTYFLRARSESLIIKMVPVGGQVRYVCDGKTLLVGDAAGTVIPINGGGVPTALVSGHIAGEIASRHLNGDYNISSYATDLRKNIGYVLKRGYLYRRLADRFMYSDDVFERILAMIGVKSIAKIIKCEPILGPFI